MNISLSKYSYTVNFNFEFKAVADGLLVYMPYTCNDTVFVSIHIIQKSLNPFSRSEKIST